MKKKIGLSIGKVEAHVACFTKPEQQIAYLWKLLDHEALYTTNTEENVIAALKKSYDWAVEKYQYSEHKEKAKYFETKAAFGKTLIEKGYVALGKKQLEATVEQFKKYVESSKPNSNQYEMYDSHKSVYGCGYEDITTRYLGFNEKGYAAAWKEANSISSMSYEFEKAVKAIIEKTAKDTGVTPKAHETKLAVTGINTKIGDKHETKSVYEKLEEKAETAETLYDPPHYYGHGWTLNEKKLHAFEHKIESTLETALKTGDTGAMQTVYGVAKKVAEKELSHMKAVGVPGYKWEYYYSGGGKWMTSWGEKCETPPQAEALEEKIALYDLHEDFVNDHDEFPQHYSSDPTAKAVFKKMKAYHTAYAVANKAIDQALASGKYVTAKKIALDKPSYASAAAKIGDATAA